MKKILIITFLLLSISFAIVKYYNNLIINYSFENFYTGRVDDKSFIAKNLFSDNYKILAATNYNFSEGIFISKYKDNYLVISNTNGFNNRFSTLITYFDDNLKVYQNKLMSTYSDFWVSRVYQSYNSLFLIGLIENVFDVDLVFSNFEGGSIRFGTNLTDYPFYFSEYQNENFKGYLVLSIIDRNNYRDFRDLELSYKSKRFNSDSILISFIDQKMKVKKYLSLRFPRNVIDIEVIRKSIDSVLIRVDFIDRISGNYIVNNYINIAYDQVSITNINMDPLNQFYIDEFISFKNLPIIFYTQEVSMGFKEIYLRRGR